ncbi:MAG TPA: FkbM family methyltransferase [Candidatus Paceibacterota bacterium]|nr:FkbM family methyltransferase [Candidatus Paceibacterota bacterium]
MVKKIIKKIFPKSIINLGVKVVTFLKVKYYSLIFKPLIIRKNTTDINVFKGIFVFNELELPIDINPKLIIDAGAYTGLSSLYYSLKYPNAKILAIEPEDSNFKILERHTKNNSNIFRVNAGLWYRDAFLKITDRNTGKWGFVTEETSESNYDIKAVTIDTLLKQSGFDKIDILKLDIEGSERDLFSNDCSSWIDKVNVIAIELHDRIKDGCTKTLYSIINKDDWKEYKKGEKVILVNKKIC